MYINLPNKAGDALVYLENAQKGLVFSALIAHVEGISTDHYEQDMTPEARMAFSFLVMWNDAQREKFQAKRIKYNQENRSGAV